MDPATLFILVVLLVILGWLGYIIWNIAILGKWNDTPCEECEGKGEIWIDEGWEDRGLSGAYAGWAPCEQCNSTGRQPEEN